MKITQVKETKKSKQMFCLFTVLAFALLLISSCKKVEVDNSKLPYVMSNSVTNITTTSALCGGWVVMVGIDTITVKGICWSTNPNPTIADSIISKGSGQGKFVVNLTGLTANTKYYMRVFACNKVGTSYGCEQIIKTYTGTVTDIDGNVYYTVTIGTQTWMAENLKTTKYRNGDPITNAIEDSVWSNPSTKGYCNYNNDSTNGNIYGHLYNWFVATDRRNIAPLGWHVPSDKEWTILIKYLGGDTLACDKLVECDWSQTHWAFGTGTNESGFTALPGGYRNSLGGFTDLHYVANYWASTDNSSDFAYYINLFTAPIPNMLNTTQKREGASVRCIKD